VKDPLTIDTAVPLGPNTLQSVSEAEPAGKFVKLVAGTVGVSKLPLRIILAFTEVADTNKLAAAAMLRERGLISRAPKLI
jgi:hypothetical protein